MKKKFFFSKIVILFFICICNYLNANDYILSTLSSNEGLSQQDVECIIQDKYGYIWVGTYDGLNKYDGNKFTHFRHIPGNVNSISDNRIISLQEWPERDEIWIGTDGGGLNCLNMKTMQFKRYPENLIKGNTPKNNLITCLYISNKSLWIGTSNGVSKLHFTENKNAVITQYVLMGIQGKSKVRQHVLTITEDNSGTIIAGTIKGLYQKKTNDNEFRLVQGIDNNIKQVLKDKVGNIWVLTESKINFYSVSSQKIQNYLSNPYILDFTTPDYYRKIMPISENLYIFINGNRVFWVKHNYNSFNFEELTFSQNVFFKKNNLKALMLDKSMNVWLTSGLDGIAHFDLNAKPIYQLPLIQSEKDDKNSIQAIITDSKRRMWIASTYGILVKEPNNSKSIKVKGINEMVYGILEDKHNNIWITAFNNIYFIPKGNIAKIKKIDEKYNLPKGVYPFEAPYAIHQDKERDIIWIGLRSGILQIKNNNNEKFIFDLKNIQPFESFRATNNITILHLDKKFNCLLIGTKNSGLIRANLSALGDIVKITPIGRQTNEKQEHIWSILESTEGTIYIGTDSGLKELTRNSNGKLDLVPIKEDDRLQSYKIVSIIEDNYRNLWLSTSFGLLCYSLKNKQVTPYYNTDGLNTNVLTEGGLYDSEKNKLYLGTIKGVNVIDLSSLNINNVAPETQFTSLSVNNTNILPGENFNGRAILESSLETTSQISLKHNENNFTIEFASLHFSNPAKNSFSYKLQGFSDNWTTVNNIIRSATFTNVPSGKYTLLLKSANGDGVWNKTAKSLKIVIKPAPWKTIWAYLFYLIVFVALLYIIYRYYSDRKKMRYEHLLEQIEHKKEVEIAEEKLKYHTNITHELRTPLSLIIAPTDELLLRSYEDEYLNSQLNIIKSNTSRLLQLINQFLDFRKVVNEKYILNVGNENVSIILNEIKNHFTVIALQKKISIELFNDLVTPYCWCDKEIITKICYNLLSNALQYTPNNGKIFIYASQNQDNNNLNISIEDTGIGIEEKEIDKIFNRFYQVPGTLGGTGIGLNLCQQFALIHKGKISVKSSVGKGSIFTLEIPVSKIAYKETGIIDSQNYIEEQEEFVDIDLDSEATEIKNAPVVLVVEDNYDLCDYIENLLKEDMTVIVSNNGEDGYNMAVNNIPDIIVSDIMMPVLDGIEMTKKCKEDMHTSHIPIILLTAKYTDENEIEGLSYGADDYITKPFNAQILKLRINNLLRLTKKKIKEVNEDKGKLNERESKFLEKFENIVFENISVPEFGVEDICRIMFMSRMQLYRKMAAVIDKKPIEYLKEIRMKRAYELMKEKGMNITEVMFEVGYSNYSYFSRRFIEVNGISPREVLGLKS